MSKNVIREGVSSKELTTDYFDYSKAKQNIMPIDIFENEYIAMKLGNKGDEYKYLAKNYKVPIITKGGRKLVKEISQRTAQHYEIYIKVDYVTSEGIKTRPKLINYLKYSLGYEPMSPEQLIQYNIDWMKKHKREVTKEIIDNWQNELDTYTFLHR
jgi:hypothetical protein